MNDLVGFLTVRLDEDGEAIRDVMAEADRHRAEHPEMYTGAAVVPGALSGEFMLADIDAKRRIIVEHRDEVGQCVSCCGHEWDHSHTDWPCVTLRLLALPYVDHPDYDEAWRP